MNDDETRNWKEGKQTQGITIDDKMRFKANHTNFIMMGRACDATIQTRSVGGKRRKERKRENKKKYKNKK